MTTTTTVETSRSPNEQASEGLSREMLVLGISPRSYQHVLALARVTAFLNARTYVLPGDVKEIFCDAALSSLARVGFQGAIWARTWFWKADN